jgi:hypothetical protein
LQFLHQEAIVILNITLLLSIINLLAKFDILYKNPPRYEKQTTHVSSQ